MAPPPKARASGKFGTSSGAGRSDSGGGGMDTKLLDFEANKLINCYLDSDNAQNAGNCYAELRGLPLFEQAVSSSPGIPLSVQKRVQLALFCHDVLGKHEESNLAAACRAFEGDDFLPEGVERHDGTWSLALDLRTQAMLQAMKSAEGGRNGAASLDEVCPTDLEDVLEPQSPVSTRRRFDFLQKAKERKDEFQENSDWIALSRKYDWLTFSRSMRNYLKQLAQQFSTPDLLPASQAFVDSLAVGAWSPDTLSKAPSTATERRDNSAKSSSAVAPTLGALAPKPPSRSKSPLLERKAPFQQQTRRAPAGAKKKARAPFSELPDEDLFRQQEDDFLQLLAELKDEDFGAAKKPAVDRPGGARKPLASSNGPAAHHPAGPAGDLGTTKSRLDQGMSNKRRRLSFEGDLADKVAWDSDSDEETSSKRPRFDAGAGMRGRARTPEHQDTGADDAAERRSHRSNSVFQMSPIRMQPISPLRAKREEPKGSKGSRAAADSVEGDVKVVKTAKRQRKPWTTQELQALEEGLEKFGTSWAKIVDLYGAEGTISTILQNRTQVDLKDKARNERHRREKAKLPLGIFELVKGYN